MPVALSFLIFCKVLEVILDGRRSTTSKLGSLFQEKHWSNLQINQEANQLTIVFQNDEQFLRKQNHIT